MKIYLDEDLMKRIKSLKGGKKMKKIVDDFFSP
jgi:hypothetical protein